MKSIQPTKNLVLILLLLQWGIAPCAGVCGKAGCAAGETVSRTLSPPAAPACHACTEAQAHENVLPKVSNNISSCCPGARSLPSAVSPQQIAAPEAAFHSSAAASAAGAVSAIPPDRPTTARSGEPPPSRDSRAIYQILCDLRI